jgi:flagellar motor switch protein FliM
MRHHEWLNSQVERLNEWLAARYHDASDTADSVIGELDTLRGQVERLRVELAAAIGERDAADVGCAAAERERDDLRGQAVRLRVELAAAIGERDAADVGCAAAEARAG